jgi:hypothetical protein
VIRPFDNTSFSSIGIFFATTAMNFSLQVMSNRHVTWRLRSDGALLAESCRHAHGCN